MKDLLEMKKKAAEMIGKRREYVVASKAVSIDTEKKTAIFVMSSEEIDRYGDIVDQDSWILTYFLLNPYFALQHRSNDFPIGKWLRVWFEADPNVPGRNRMLGEAQFNDKYEDAARAFDHVVNGEMNMVSVGFIPHRIDYDENKDAFILFDCELLECSLVGIGANRAALVKGKCKGVGICEDGDCDHKDPITPIERARESTKDALKSLDSALAVEEDNRVIHHLAARELLNKAVRKLVGNK